MQRGTGVIAIHSGSSTGPVVATSVDPLTETLSISGSTLTIHHTATLADGTHYYVTLDQGSIKDIAGNSFAGSTSYDFTTVTAAIVAHDTTPPTVLSFSPPNSSSGVGVGSDIVLTFNEAVQKGTGTIAIHSGSSTGPVVATSDDPLTETLSISGSTLTIHHANTLAYGTHYYVTLDQGSIKDVGGNSFAGTTSYDFTTTAATTPTTSTDTTPPTVIAFSPPNSASGVGVSSDIVLTFSEAVQKGTGAIAIHSDSSTGTVVATSDDPLTETISISGSTLTIHHTNALAYGTHYFVTFGQTSVNDLAGNHFAGSTPYDFYTDQAPIATTVQIPVVTSGGGNSDTAPAIVGVGILGILSWVIF